MKISLECSCGNVDSFQLCGKSEYTPQLHTATQPIYLWSDAPGRIMVKCLACNKENEV